MRTRIAVLVSFVLLAACGEATRDDVQAEVPAQAERPTIQDPDAQRVWSRMMGTISPDGGWERTRYLEFHWAVRRGEGEPLVRQHRWDRWDGLARVEAPVDGSTMVAIFPTDAPREGRVWMDGEELEGEEAADRLDSAYRTHINDAYWLLMPFKWADPGVSARYVGEETDEDGRTWEVVELSFEAGTGLTPQNMYRGFVDPETWRMERWYHYSNADADPSPTDWTDWRRVGPIELSENRRVGGEPRIFFPHLRAETSVPPGAFDPPGG